MSIPSDYHPGETRTLIEAAEANALLSAVRGLSNVQISPNGYGTVLVGETAVIFDLSPLLEQVLKAVSDFLNAGGNANDLTNRLTNVEARLNAASASGSCDNNGNINIAFKI